MIAAAGGDGDQEPHLRAWKVTSEGIAAEPVVLSDDSGNVQLFAFSADGRLLITAGDEPALHVWDMTRLKGQRPATLLNGQTTPTQGVAFSADGHWLATTGTR